MMQHEMRPAMHEEQMLGVIIDMGLQHDIEGQHARDKTDLPPQRRRLGHQLQAAREPGQRQRRGQEFRPVKFPGQENRQIGGTAAPR